MLLAGPGDSTPSSSALEGSSAQWALAQPAGPSASITSSRKPSHLPAKTDYSFCAPSCYVWTIAATWSYLSPATFRLLLQTVVPFVGSTLNCHLHFSPGSADE